MLRQEKGHGAMTMAGRAETACAWINADGAGIADKEQQHRDEGASRTAGKVLFDFQLQEAEEKLDAWMGVPTMRTIGGSSVAVAYSTGRLRSNFDLPSLRKEGSIVSVTSISEYVCHQSGWRRTTLALCPGVVALKSGYAQLSGFYPITGDGVSLNNADFTVLVDAANDLLSTLHLVKGDNTSWRNGQTGSHGTISVMDSFHHGSMMCHTLNYLTNPMANPSANTVVLKWCKTADGSWKILS